MVEHQARDLEVRGSNHDPGSNFSLEFKVNLSNNHLLISRDTCVTKLPDRKY